MADRYTDRSSYTTSVYGSPEEQKRRETDKDKLGMHPGEVEGKKMWPVASVVDELDQYKQREETNRSVYSGQIPGSKLRKVRRR